MTDRLVTTTSRGLSVPHLPGTVGQRASAGWRPSATACSPSPSPCWSSSSAHPRSRPANGSPKALWRQWPSYVAYLVSFLTIGVIWLNHHWILHQRCRLTCPCWCSTSTRCRGRRCCRFPPQSSPTTWGRGEAARTAAALYTGVLVLLSLASLALFTWVTHDQRRHRLPPAALRASRVQFLVGLAIYGAAFACRGSRHRSPWPSAGRWRSTTAASISAVGQAPMLAEPDVSSITQDTTASPET
jgi:Endosomal/lysosomal potassium channel TMEM175